MKRPTALILGLSAAVVLAAVFWEEARLLLLGWATFLGRNFSKVTVNFSGVATGLAAILLFLGLTHYLGRWWCSAAGGGGPPRRRWHFRWTLAVLVLLIVAFTAGFSAIGLARQLGWLLSSREPVYVEHVDGHWED